MLFIAITKTPEPNNEKEMCDTHTNCLWSRCCENSINFTVSWELSWWSTHNTQCHKCPQYTTPAIAKPSYLIQPTAIPCSPGWQKSPPGLSRYPAPFPRGRDERRQVKFSAKESREWGELLDFEYSGPINVLITVSFPHSWCSSSYDMFITPYCLPMVSKSPTINMG